MKFNIFDNFSQAKESQEYDHIYQKSFGLASASGVDFETVRQLKLYEKDINGQFLLDQYLKDNSITIEFPEIYEDAKRLWHKTDAWAIIYGYQDKFVYRKDHSDRTYEIVDLDSLRELKIIDENGDEVEVGNG